MGLNRTHVEQTFLDLVGQQIQKLRIASGLSQERLAEISGIHRTYIGAVERGERNMSLISLMKMTKALNTNFSSVFELVSE